MSSFTQTLIGHPIVPFFLLVNTFLGIWVYRKTKIKGFYDYALASRSLPVGVLVMTLLATRIGSGDLAEPDRVFHYGLIQTLISFVFIALFLITGRFIAPSLIHFRGCMTTGDLMGNFYGRYVKVLTGVLSLIFSILIIDAQLRSIGHLSDVILGISPRKAIVCFGFLVLFYSIWGGVRSVSYTDIFQAIGAFLVLGYIAHSLSLVITKGSFFANIPQEKLRFFSHPQFFHKVSSVTFWGVLPTFIFTPPVVQRMLMLQNKKQVQRMWYVSAVLYGLILMMLTVIGLGALSAREKLGITSSFDLLPQLIRILFKENSWIIDCVFVGLLGILLSTIDSYLHSVGITLVQDVISPLRKMLSKNPLNEKQKVVYAKAGMFCIGILTIGIGYMGRHELENQLVHFLSVIIFSIVLIPLILAVVGLKSNTIIFLSFTLSYLFTTCVLTLLGWHPYLGTLTGVGVGLVAFFLTHIVTYRGLVIKRPSGSIGYESRWQANWRNMIRPISIWSKIRVLDIPGIACEKASKKPIQARAFALFMITVYTLSTITSGGTGAGRDMTRWVIMTYCLALIMCLGLLLSDIWPTKIKRYFSLYWFLALFYCLPFGWTFTCLCIYKGAFSSVSSVTGLALLSSVIESTSFLVLSSIGTLFAFGLYILITGSIPAGFFSINFENPSFYAFCTLVVAVLVFFRRQEKSIQKRLYVNRIASSSLAHEMRDKLHMMSGMGTVLQNAFQEGNFIKDSKGKKGFFVSKKWYDFLDMFSGQMIEKAQEGTKELKMFTDFIEQQGLTCVCGSMSVYDLVKESVERLSTKYSKHIEIKVTCKKDFKAKVLQGIFPNVILNLVKNAHNHGDASLVEIIVDGNARVIHVRDNGRGIHPNIMPHIFQLFYSSNLSSGIGLAFVKMVIGACGGVVTCDSKYNGKGAFTEFTIHLP